MAKTTRRATALIGLFLFSLTSTCDASAATSPPASPLQHALAAALTEAKSAGSARISVQFFTGSTSRRVVQDSTLETAEQTTAIRKEVVPVVLVGGADYISGNTAGLTSYFGQPGSVASTLSGKWVSIQPTDSSFQSISANVDLTSAFANVTPGRGRGIQWLRQVRHRRDRDVHALARARARRHPDDSRTAGRNSGRLIGFGLGIRP